MSTRHLETPPPRRIQAHQPITARPLPTQMTPKSVYKGAGCLARLDALSGPHIQTRQPFLRDPPGAPLACLDMLSLALSALTSRHTNPSQVSLWPAWKWPAAPLSADIQTRQPAPSHPAGYYVDNSVAPASPTTNDVLTEGASPVVRVISPIWPISRPYVAPL